MRHLSFLSAVLACLLLAALGALTVVDILDGPGSDRQEFEARTPHRPDRVSQLPRFIADTRYYVGQRYALKKHFVMWRGRMHLALFGHSPHQEVGIGKQGYLFYQTEAPVAQAQGRARLTEPQRAEWDLVLSETRAEFTARGMRYRYLVGPNKHTIYADMLPSWIQGSPQASSQIKGVVEAARSTFGADYPDARRRLLDIRKQNPERMIYHRSDTHWSEWAAAIAVQDMMAHMGVVLPDPEYRLETLERSGDLSRMIGQQRRMTVTGPRLHRRWVCSDETGETVDIVTIDPLIPSPVFCGSPTGRPEPLVVFHDSFGVAAIPYLSAHFQNVTFIWTDQADPVRAERYGAKYVLHIQVERKLMRSEPALMVNTQR